jgi:hypothetical protein
MKILFVDMGLNPFDGLSDQQQYFELEFQYGYIY